MRPAPGAEPAKAGVSPTVLAEPVPAAPGRLLDRRFGRDEITLVRHEVSARLTAAGLGGDRLAGFVLAVNEIVTNVVLHAGGSGRVLLWLAGGSAWCSVTDSGPGIPAHLTTPEIPEAYEVGGRGIWLAHQLCDEVTVATGPIGTTIGLRIVLATPA
ncbi:ATP-binding protein [Paractinoplanes abujensis]|uniref:Anti-sigma regulatory factor (Ser/Thr protein kinase) n=1 Tax=Paractinoplanes abujensis TaxID=882441 RepID=A0A7W7G496_9ACTN|nr:ATP-binding protein [Actinoplanes abujensis]MBB4695707.1 anti-sigma regulatory factor (Ser/Thr protein kinase) [Actinoplanes abujensis]